MPDIVARPRVGFIGTGLIGTPMVQRLLECGLSVSVWNRTLDKATPLVEFGATLAESPRALAESCDIVCLCLTNTVAVHDVVFGPQGIDAVLREGQLLIDLSSIAPDTTREMAERLAGTCGARWIDAPVSGGLPLARAGRLIVFAGGNADDIARAAAVFDALSQRVTHMGGHGAGQLTKSCNQMIVACNLVTIAEMLAFANKSGIDAARLPGAMAGGFADSLPLQVFGPRMASGVDAPRIGGLGTFRKDIDQVVRLAGECGAYAPMATRAAALLLEASQVESIGADPDVSRVIKLFVDHTV
ncbi:NAD(P)-dependent oxidoreductase [Gemmatimonas groenlandica]|uniref:NAD(P)-dependent oxidoreductase n=1 Tax=Gemmatimonas groenlandica TaxID=2732249 RepID=A0A6M4IYR2_9BACT|nr:NAD(P)-dependent oxidoreductase [Gemmatimonas groenlandica]QJR37381.1 NAD(P)-dependent oxidoreductase [Gemmatimonas groenlandica]